MILVKYKEFFEKFSQCTSFQSHDIPNGIKTLIEFIFLISFCETQYKFLGQISYSLNHDLLRKELWKEGTLSP